MHGRGATNRVNRGSLLRHRLDSQRNYRNNTAAALTIRNAQKTVAEKPEFAGTVKFVETHDFVRKKEESPTGEGCHEFKNGETYFLIGDALGNGMKELLCATPQKSRNEFRHDPAPRPRAVRRSA